jgi:type II secretory pathway component PulF
LIALFVFQFFAFVVLLIPVCLFFFGKTLIPPGKMTQIRWRLRLGNPLTGGLWRSLLVTLFLDTWSILQRVGFPLYSSHDLLLQLFPYHFMKKNIDRFFHRIQNGESPDVAIVELQFLDSATRAAMEIGRMSGTGDQLIKTVSELSMMELSTKTAAILSVTSSLFITVGSLLVGLTILLSAWSVFS